MKRYILFVVSLLIALGSVNTQAQIKIKIAPKDYLSSADSIYLDFNRPNKIIDLSNNWSIYIDKGDDKVSGVKVPAVFEGEDVLYFERSFNLTKQQIENNNVRLCFNGINHSAEILVNNVQVFKSIGGDYPFYIDLAKDLLKYSSSNKIIVKVSNILDAENTIPVKSRFLFPKQLGGINRNVYLKLTSLVNIANVKTSYNLSNDLSKAKIHFVINVDKKRTKDKNRDFKALYPNPFTFEISVVNSKDRTQIANYRGNFNLSNSDVTTSDVYLDVQNPKLWSFNNPENYIYDIKLYYNDELLDRSKSLISFYSLKFNDDKITLNNTEQVLRGTTYYTNTFDRANLISLYGIERDLKIIKDMGFNVVRFAKAIPHPYALYMCEKLGLLAFIEMPINSIPENLLIEPNFKTFAEENVNLYINNFAKYSAVAAIGVGSSFLPNNQINEGFISHLASVIKSKSGKYSYASFFGFPTRKINGLDLYGVELYSQNISERFDEFTGSAKELGKKKVFVSEVTYPTFVGSSNGYLTPFSLEAQANFFQELLDFAKENEIDNLFINSAFDYTGAVSGFYAGYNNNNIYKVGIVGIDRNVNSLSYKVIKSKLFDGEKVTIPIGKKLDDTPLFFILSSIIISVIMALLINARRKFREDATRALVRPYNFFADIRDQRLLSGWHANILLVILSATHSLLLTNLLYSLRGNILLEKAINGLGIRGLSSIISYFAWNPVQGFIYLFFVSAIGIIVLTLIIKWCAFFAKIKVFITNVYYVVIWSFLPLVLLLPFELVLYKIISLNIANMLVYLILALFALWLIKRLLKGIYVIFDSKPFNVYVFSILVIGIILGSIFVYLQVSNSAVDYITNSISQFALL
jgi:beta-galactosidase